MAKVEIFPWNEWFNTGISDIDAQHRQLIDLLNTMVNHMAFDANGYTTNVILDEFKRYTDFHFRSEEAIWGEVFSGGSWQLRHEKSHQHFVTGIHEIEVQNSSLSPEDMTKDLFRFLTHWLVLHIIEQDNCMAKVVHAVRTGRSLEQAKKIALRQMSGATRAMIESLTSMYDHLAERTLQLSHEFMNRCEAERSLIDASCELQSKANIIEDRSAQLDAMFNLSPDGFVAFSREGKIKFANPAFQSMTGIPLEEISGCSLHVLDASLKKRCVAPRLYKGIKSLFSGIGKEPVFRKITLNNPQHTVLQIVAISSDSASISKILYFRNITRESEIDQMKSDFLTTAAHELRNPMASIYGFTEVLTTQNLDQATRKDILGIIYKQSELMVSILNELLDLARIESRQGKDFNLQIVSVQSLINATISGYHLPSNRCAPTFTCPNELIHVRVDREKFMQVLTNVLSNAYKYSPSGGKVSISAEISPASLFGEKILQPMVSISISDQGIGMSTDQIARVGERFYRADKTGGIPGTGLGMSIVKELVELHHGCITLQSELNIGTTVTLSIPLTQHIDYQPDYTVEIYECQR